MKNAAQLIRHIQRAAPSRYKKASELTSRIQELITDDIKEEKEKEAQDKRSRDPLEGKAINRYDLLLSKNHPDDWPTFEEMDSLLKGDSYKHSLITDEITLLVLITH